MSTEHLTPQNNYQMPPPLMTFDVHSNNCNVCVSREGGILVGQGACHSPTILGQDNRRVIDPGNSWLCNIKVYLNLASVPHTN